MDNELMHYGILGMKWGVRRYQNSDGTWTSAGKKRYNDNDGSRRGQSSEESDRGTKKTSSNQKESAKQKAINYVQRYRTMKIVSLYIRNRALNQERQRLFREYRRESMRSITDKNAREKANQYKKALRNTENTMQRNRYNRMRWQSSYARTDGA